MNLSHPSLTPSMPSRTIRVRALSAALTLALSAFAGNLAFAQNRTATQYKINPPPSAELRYAIEAQQSGLNLKGNGLVQWTAQQQQYSVHNETRAQLFGKILDTRSEGKIDGYGLAPAQLVEKRLRKDATTTTFNADSKTITFSQSQQTYPIVGGEQDRTRCQACVGPPSISTLSSPLTVTCHGSASRTPATNNSNVAPTENAAGLPRPIAASCQIMLARSCASPGRG